EMERMLKKSGRAKLEQLEAQLPEANVKRPLRGRNMDLSHSENLTVDEANRLRIGRFVERNAYRMGALTAEEVDERSLEGMRVDEHSRYSAMPLAQMVSCATLAVLLLGGQFWVETLPAPLGSAFAN